MIFLLLTGKFFIRGVKSERCLETEKVYFDPKSGINCGIIPGAYKHSIVTICVLETCADLLDHKDSSYCGKGDCYIFGFSCDGGCIQFNEDLIQKNQSTPSIQDAFGKKYGHLVTVPSKVELHRRFSMAAASRRG